MKLAAKLLLTVRTVRHMRPKMIYWQLRRRVTHPMPVVAPSPPRRQMTGTWVEPPARPSVMRGPTTFRILNETIEVASPDDWNFKSAAAVNTYNLNYFDDLAAQGWRDRIQWHRALIGRWIREVPIGEGRPWHAYPTALRIVNWIKWILAGNEPDREMLDSLFVQGRHLQNVIEWEIQNNHVLADGKGILFLGAFLFGSEADAFVRQGFRIVADEFKEEILADGGHYERSPMYHGIILGDVLDVINLVRAYPNAFTDSEHNQVEKWIDMAGRMRDYHRLVLHPDDDVSFFNDAARGIAPSGHELDEYAERLKLPALNPDPIGLTHLSENAFVRVRTKDLWLLADVGDPKPSYACGHAHAETLCFELSLFGQRVLVNTGTSTYAVSPRRLVERATAAHNTVVVDGQNSSEVWASFRVARRAHAFDFSSDSAEQKFRFGCSHDGYRRLPGKVVHRRDWQVSDGGLIIEDSLSGKVDTAAAYFHLSPATSVKLEGTRLSGTVQGGQFEMHVTGARVRLESYEYAPEFGLLQAGVCLVAEFEGDRITTNVTWTKSVGAVRPPSE